ncbi:MAG: ABC transporter substrate-binding protein [Acidobacteriota bacterium]
MTAWRLMAILTGMALGLTCRGRLPDSIPRIGYMQLLEDPQLDEGRRGFLQALQDGGFNQDRDYVLEYRCAQGDQTLLPTIVQGFLTDRVRLIATNTTPCMLAAANVTSGAGDPVPIVITIVSPPGDVGLRVVPANMTGYYNPNDMAEYLRVIVSCLPGPVQRLGLLTNPAEPNALAAAEALARACAAAGIDLRRMPVSSLNEVPDAARALAGQDVQAFITAADNTLYNSMPMLAKVAEEFKLPVFASEAGIVQSGAAVGWGLDYYDWGYQSGTVAAQLLRGTPLSELPLRPYTRYQLFLNQAACQQQGLTITDDMRRRADKIL